MIKTAQLGFAAAQNFGKKHFATAVKATKELKAKVTAPGWVKSNIKAIPLKAKTFGTKHKVALVAGGGAAGTVVGYQSGKKKGIRATIKGYEKTILASSAKELGYKSFRQVRNLPIEQKKKIATRAAKKYMKQGRDFITFYS